MPFNEEVEQANRREFEELLKRRSSTAHGSEAKSESLGKPVELTDSDFGQAAQSHPLMVVDFWAPWCAPCRIVSPMLEALASQYAGKVAFGKLNVDENPVVAAMFGIESIPTIVIFRNGKPVDGVIGAAPKSHIEDKIRTYLGGSYSRPSPYQ